MAGFGNRSEALEQMVRALREEKHEIAQQLDQMTQQVTELMGQLESVCESVAPEESVRLSEERSALARERLELNAQKQQLQASSAGDRSDHRIRAFREHLREIHMQEKQERESRSLAGRISRLWSSVDRT